MRKSFMNALMQSGSQANPVSDLSLLSCQPANASTNEQSNTEQLLSYAEAIAAYGSRLDRKDFEVLGRPCLSDIETRRFTRKELQCMADTYLIRRKFEEDKKKETTTQLAQEKIREESALAAHNKAAEELLHGGRTMKKIKATFKPYSDSKLPQDIWIKILKMLCDGVGGIEPGTWWKQRRVSDAARDLSNVSRVNKELYSASMLAFQHLDKFSHPLADLLGSDYAVAVKRLGWREDFLQILISDPASLSSVELKDIYRRVWTYRYPSGSKSKSKANMATNIYRAFGLKAPTCHSARLVLSVLSENKKFGSRPIGFLWARIPGDPAYCCSHPICEIVVLHKCPWNEVKWDPLLLRAGTASHIDPRVRFVLTSLAALLTLK